MASVAAVLNVTLYVIHLVGSTTPSKITRPTRYTYSVNRLAFNWDRTHLGEHYYQVSVRRRDEPVGRQGLTVDEIESDNGTIRPPPIIDRLTLSQDRIPQRHKVPNGGARPNVLQVRSTGAVLATCCEVRELLVGQIGLRIQLANILFAELPRDGFVDEATRSAIPEMRTFIRGIETINLSGANTINNRIERA